MSYFKLIHVVERLYASNAYTIPCSSTQRANKVNKNNIDITSFLPSSRTSMSLFCALEKTYKSEDLCLIHI